MLGAKRTLEQRMRIAYQKFLLLRNGEQSSFPFASFLRACRPKKVYTSFVYKEWRVDLMKEITMDVLHDAAHRLLFDMSEKEYETLYEEFEIITKQMKKIGSIEGIDEEEPMTFPFFCETSYLREDVAEKPLDRDEALQNAGSKQDGQIKLPKVVL